VVQSISSSRAATAGGLAVKGLSVRLGGEARPILRDLDLQVNPAQAVGLAGRSGCGKSTLIHAVAGLVPWLRPADVDGDVALAGDSLIDLDPGQRAHLLATCLDRPDGQLFLPTVGQELAAACHLHRCKERAQELASIFAVSNLRHRRITELSSGQRQRVALACAFAGSPRPVLLDEPTAHLDSTLAAELLVLLEGLLSAGRTLIIATHDPLVFNHRMVTRLVSLRDGRVRCRIDHSRIYDPGNVRRNFNR